MRKRIKQKREKEGKNKKKPGIQRVLHLSYDRTDSKREYPTQCRSRNRDHRVRHRRPRLDDVSTTTTTTTAGRYHLLTPTSMPGTRLSITRFERCRLTRRRDKQNEIKANARIAHDLHVERHASGSRICIPRFGARSPSFGETVTRSRKKNRNSQRETRLEPLTILILKIVTSAVHFALCSLRSAMSISHM